MEKLNLEEYIQKGMKSIIKSVVSFKNPKTAAYMLSFVASFKKMNSIRKKCELSGTHIPAFLIAGITKQCNLNCKGCYARTNHNVGVCDEKGVLSSNEWDNIFTQAEDLGIPFILLAGGEPFLRRDVLTIAAEHKKIIFPVFTNGTIMNSDYLKILDKNRNIIPILSIEGGPETTDNRRGKGVYDKLSNVMNDLHKNNIIFGVSITVTNENLSEIMSNEFVANIKKRGCRAVVYVEYVPVDGRIDIAPGEKERMLMDKMLEELRAKNDDILFLSFPGDENKSSGCLAAGRGFFYINAHGQAQPCPFSPYSDTDLKNISLLEALKSNLFIFLRENTALHNEHKGGCVLFENQDLVKEILNR